MRIIYHTAIVLVLLLIPFPAEAENEKKNILYLNSYHHGYEWSDAILEGVRSVLEESEYKINLQVEYMDVKRFSYDEVSYMLLRLYREKFQNEYFDAVMVSDNDAYRFATENREELFPGIPLVFCGVNDFDESSLEQGNITGVEENFDLQLTLDVALKIHPDMKRMVVVGDKSTAGVTIRAQIEAAMPAYADRLNVEYWTDMPLEEMLEKLETLPSDSFLFFIPFYHSIDGQFYTAEETMQAIYKESTLPIYTAWEFLLGHGAVGGHMLSGFRHGQQAASMTLRILNGEKASSIPVLREPTGEYAFDYEALWRLSISQDLLPKNSRIINAPSPFYELPKQLLWTMVIGFLIVLVVLFFLVITMLERRKVERKILDQLAFQETLMDAVPLLVSWKDKDGRYLGTNQAFAEFFGFEHGDSVVNLTSGEVMRDPSHVKWAMRADMEVITKHRAFRKVRRNLTDAEGNQAWLEINKVPIRDQAGNVVGVLSTAENITKEQDLEKQLLQSQKMEAIGTLAGGIAHDFNNILTSIINSTELAISDIEPDSVTSKDLMRVLKAARRGGRVVKQILAFSRPSTEGFRPTDVGAVVSEVLGLMEASMPGNIQVRSSIRSNLPMVHADPTQLHQVAMNLCTNSFHALRQEGGVIEAHVNIAQLDVEQARILSLEPGEYVRMAIEDDGPGIPPEIMDKIFDPFFTTKDKTEGTGLGLSVVHGIIRSHRGGLQVLSHSEGGTVFEIYLPKADKEVIVGVNGSAAKERKWAHILFIEDDYDQLVTTPRLLESMGYEVTAMGTPEDALIKVKGMSNLFDLVITDYDMPGMSGTQFASKLIELTPNLPVILVSGREDASAAAARFPNIRGVIIKPYDKDTLSAAISGVIDE